MSDRISGRGAWNAANARLANKPFDDLFAADNAMNEWREYMLALIANHKMTQAHTAAGYAYLIANGQQNRHMQTSIMVDDRIGEVNRAIVARWSVSGLNRIKSAAWKLAGYKS